MGCLAPPRPAMVRHAAIASEALDLVEWGTVKTTRLSRAEGGAQRHRGEIITRFSHGESRFPGTASETVVPCMGLLDILSSSPEAERRDDMAPYRITLSRC